MNYTSLIYALKETKGNCHNARVILGKKWMYGTDTLCKNCPVKCGGFGPVAYENAVKWIAEQVEDI